MKLFDKKTTTEDHSVAKVKVKVTQPCLTLCDPVDYTVHGILQARILEWVAFPSPRIFPAQGLNPGLPHCRQILYQLSHKGSPFSSGTLTNRILSCLRRLLRTGECPTDTTATVQWSSAKHTRVESRCFSLDFGTQT